MVEDHIEDHFDAIFVQRFHQLLEFVDLAAIRARSRITRFRREETDGVVAPVINEQFSGLLILARILELVKVEDRHQFDRS